jgi:hypothetical protein
MNKITIKIGHNTICLPLVQSQQGMVVAPLKPIADEIGLPWAEQLETLRPVGREENRRESLDDDEMDNLYFSRRMGICLEKVFFEGLMQEMICIRADRIAAYMHSIDTDRLAAAGNHEAAELLRAKQEEWDGVIARAVVMGN